PLRSSLRKMVPVPCSRGRAPTDYHPPAAASRIFPPPRSSLPSSQFFLTRAEIVSALSPGLPQEIHVGNLDRFIQRFAHVVDRQGGTRGGHQRFHLHPGLRSRRHCGSYFHPIFAQPRGHINVREWEWMTKRYPLRRALGSSDSRDPCYFQGISLGIFQALY